jgi:hypothetical protein
MLHCLETAGGQHCEHIPDSWSARPTPKARRGLDIPFGGSILKLMEKKPRKLLIISRRLPNGWSDRIENKNLHECDLDGAKLWIGPGDRVYCDLVHDLRMVDQVSTPRRAG